MKTREFITF